MSLENENQRALKGASPTVNTKSILKHCNNLISRINFSSSSSKSSKTSALKSTMLQTDARPLGSNDSQQKQIQPFQPNQNGVSHITPPQFAIIPPNALAVPSAQLVQNNLNQANHNVTVNQQNFNFSGCDGLQIGNVYHIPSPNAESSSSSRKNSCTSNNGEKPISSSKTKTTVELMSCQELLEAGSKPMRIAAQYIGDNWRMVFRDLDISDPEIDQIKEQYFHISLEEVIYRLLLKWERNSDEASIGILSTILWNNKNYKCVTELKKWFKEHRKSKRNSGTETTATSQNE